MSRYLNEAYKQKEQERKRLYYRTRMLEVLNLLGDHCVLCGITDRRLLQIDHIHGSGAKHRKSINNAWWKYLKDIKQSVEEGRGEFRLLCANCNWIDAIEKGYRKSIWH
jgi:hypothetical protein